MGEPIITEGVGVLDCDLIQLLIVLYKAKRTIILLDKEHGGSHRGFGWMDVAICKVPLEEVIKLLLFCRGQGEHLGAREFSVVPCLPQWELIKGFLGEDISEVMVLGQLSQLAMGCVTCHACHGCVTDFRPILGNPVEVTHVTSPGHVYIFPC